MKAKMKTQIFRRFSQYQDGWGKIKVQSMIPLSVTVVKAVNMTGRPMAEDRIQLHTLTIFALRGVRKSKALTGWHTAM